MGCLSCSPASLSDRFPTRSYRNSNFLKEQLHEGMVYLLYCKAICSNGMMVLKHKARARFILFHKRHFKYPGRDSFRLFKEGTESSVSSFHSRRSEL